MWRGHSCPCAPKKRLPWQSSLRLPKAGTPSASTPYTLPRVSVSGEKQDAVTHVPGNRTVWSDCFLRRFLRHPRAGATASRQRDALRHPGPARGPALAPLRCHRRHQRLSRADSCRQNGPLRRLFRRWVLVNPLGLPLRIRGRAVVAESALVGPHARSVGARHSFQTGAHFRLLPAIPRAHLHPHLSALGFTKTISASTNMASPPRPSAPGWPISSRISA